MGNARGEIFNVNKPRSSLEDGDDFSLRLVPKFCINLTMLQWKRPPARRGGIWGRSMMVLFNKASTYDHSCCS